MLVGYILAGISVYVAQSRAILSLERARLWQQLNHLQANFQSEVTQSKSLLFSLIGSNTIRLFVSEADSDYRSAAVGARLQESIKSLSDNPQKFVSFAIVSPKLGVDYYFENSEDPFAEIGPAQIALAKTLVAGDKLNDWTLLRGPDMPPLIVQSEFLDPTTFAKPIPSRKSLAILIQTAIRPDKFIDMQRYLEEEYGASMTFSETPISTSGGLAAIARLGPSLYIHLAAPPAYMQSRLRDQILLLGFGAIAMSFVSIGLIVLLLRRFVTNPIAQLDQQLTGVMTGERRDIVVHEVAGEIGRLSINMKKLHDDGMQSMAMIQKASWTDTLTGISNRAHFNSAAADMLERAKLDGTGCTLFFIDIDNFKFVNDKYGHKVGDDLLKALAERVAKIVNGFTMREGLETGLFARLSGDEFAILLRTTPGGGIVNSIAESILALFSDGFGMQGKSFPVTASIGIAVCPDDATHLNELISNADAAMYQAKSLGKNQASGFSRSLQDKRNRTRQIQEELRLMNPDEQFHLVYMPIVNARGTVIGCEALLRWKSPLLGVVTPDEFVPIAESSGLFTKIDWWVINKAMSDCADLKSLFGPDVILAINISSAELHSKSISGYFNECIVRHGLDAGTIEIELTETFALKLGDLSRRNIDTLRDNGFRISIDDFGAGFTSVQQIIEYTADTIKLDRALVENLTGKEAIETLRALIALCHAQNMAVVGEGVDTPEKMMMLTAAGCDLFQGYLISKPLTLDDLRIWALRQPALHEEHEFVTASLAASSAVTPIVLLDPVRAAKTGRGD
ncbi:MAG: EAL domain-containing protein [Pararhizobium sp.]|nr:EAL domain-containing protein [Pararhizobium sp.]MDO9415698.1 EAL domain-containing protein [Pararhizobium sp.]